MHDPELPLPEPARLVLDCINNSHRPLITSHIRLDGDALGSELALCHLLKLRGQSPHIVNDGPPPAVYRFLPGVESVGDFPEQLKDNYDLVIALDMPARDRAGRIFAGLADSLPVVAVDHHPVIGPTGEPEWKDPSISSTGEMIYRLAEAGDWAVSAAAATCLYTAILTDTGSFAFPNTTPSTLRIAARLIELGADPAFIAEATYMNEPLPIMMLRAETVETVRLHHDRRVAVMHITREMFRKRNVNPLDTHRFADLPRSVEGVLIGVLLREMQNSIKVSLRSRPGVNVAPVAAHFGGGGHHQAAGCEVSGDIETVEQRIVEAIAPQLAAPEASS